MVFTPLHLKLMSYALPRLPVSSPGLTHKAHGPLARRPQDPCQPGPTHRYIRQMLFLVLL